MSQDNDITRLEPLIDDFAGQNTQYYRRVFATMLSAPGYRFTLNWTAALLGPIWFGARGLWNWFLGVLVLETAAYIQIGMSLFGDLGSAQRARADSIQATLDLRYQQIEAAVNSASQSTVDSLRNAAASLEGALASAREAATAADATGLWFIGGGLLALAIVKFGVAALFNWTLEKRFGRWRSDKTVASGWSMPRAAVATIMFVATVVLSAVQFAQPTAFAVLGEFPNDGNWRLAVGDWIQDGFDWLRTAGRGVFDSITAGMRNLLDAIEVVLVDTPWPVVAFVIIMLAYLSAGPRVAIFTVVALAYLGLLDFWEKAMPPWPFWRRRR